jgi:hypothetical protein
VDWFPFFLPVHLAVCSTHTRNASALTLKALSAAGIIAIWQFQKTINAFLSLDSEIKGI